MRNLLRLRLYQLRNRMKRAGLKNYLLFILFGGGILFLLGLFFVKLFGFIYYQEEFPLVFKLFVGEKILTMVFLTLFSMMVLSALISTLNIFFLSKDLHLLFSSPLSTGAVFYWKSIEVTVNSGMMVIFFSLPAVVSYCYYFAPAWYQVSTVLVFFLLYILCGVVVGVMLGLIIPAFFSVKRLQPVLSLVSILLISSIVIFLRLLKPEQFGNPDVIRNVMSYMAGFEVDLLSYFPFAWLADAFTLVAKGEYAGLIKVMGAFVGTLALLGGLLWFVQKRYYFQLFDKLNRSSGSKFRSSWKSSFFKGDYGTLFIKEVKSFIRTPAQWSQLLIVAAIIVVFILNMRGFPIPHPSFKNLISYLNLGMAAFIVAGLNSRFTFTTIPMENPGLTHLLSSPFQKEKLYKFKLAFFAVPQVLIGFMLFFTADLALGLDGFARLSGLVFLLPLLPFLTVLALFFSLRLDEAVPLTPQHLIMSRSGIAYMLWSMVAIVAAMLYFVRPLFLYYYSLYRMIPVPWGEILTWFGGFWVLLGAAMVFFYKRSLILWQRSES